MAIAFPSPSSSSENKSMDMDTDTDRASSSSSELSPSVHRKAWATLITNPAYIAGLLTLHRTLISVSSYPLVVMTTPTLPTSSRRTLGRAGIRMIDVESIHPSSHKGFDASFARFQDTWTKLAVFGLTEFDTLVMIDSDMIFVRNMDELFEREDLLPGKDWIGAVPACVCNPLKISHYPKDWIPANCQFSLQSSPTTFETPAIPSSSAPRVSHLLNSGLVLLHPSKSIMSTLINYINTSPDIANFHFPDQEVLAEVFKGKWKPLPWWTNALKTLRAVHQDLWRDEEVRLIHYILDKPWAHRPIHLPPHQCPPVLPPTPTSSRSPSRSAKDYSPRRPLPPGLLEAVHSSLPQKGVRSYGEVHAWWWIVYEDLLDEMKAEGEASGWREMDAWVKR